jgi:hypothetical protein
MASANPRKLFGRFLGSDLLFGCFVAFAFRGAAPFSSHLLFDLSECFLVAFAI